MTKQIIVGIEKIDITDEEYKGIAKLIEENKKGLVKLRNGEYINLNNIAAIKNKKIVKTWYGTTEEK